MPLVGLIVVVIMGIIMTTNVIDSGLRKWFGVGKMNQRNNFLTRYEVWIKILILLIFAITFFRIGIESPYIAKKSF